jgi:hypothetical protein
VVPSASLKRSLLPVLAAALSPLTCLAQDGLTIDHKAVGCIVAGQFPRMTACLLPGPAVAQTRVYFRASGTPHWYFVSGTQAMPCHFYILPKPRKTTLNVDYYVAGTSKEYAQIKAFTESRTAEYKPDVVASAGECRKDVPVAPFVGKATVVVGATAGAPVIPAGFFTTGIVGAGAGVSTGVIASVVGGASAVAGTIWAISNNDTTPTTSVLTLPPGPGPAPAPPTTTTTTTTTPAQPFSASFGIIPNPAQGTEPFPVTFTECGSTGVDLKFIYDFDGDGIDDFKGGCNETRVYRMSGVSATVVTTLPPSTRKFFPRVCVGQGTRKECVIWEVLVRENTGLNAAPPEVTPASRRVAWASELDVEGASGQIVVNGEAAAFAAHGRSAGAVLGRRGVNRVEGQVVEAAGKPGTWRFELNTTSTLEAGSIRVIAGEVALVTDSAVVFHLKGRPGERIAFTFRAAR